MSFPAADELTRLLPGSRVPKMKKDAARSEAMVKTLLAAAEPHGFGPGLEGHGLPMAPAPAR